MPCPRTQQANLPACSPQPPKLCLSQQTFQAMVLPLQAQAHLVTDLLQEGYEFVIPAKFQSDPLEQRFSQYRQMSGRNFLVSLREVLSSENILLWKSLLKKGDGVLEEILEYTRNLSEIKIFHESFLKIFDETVTDNIALCKGSEEVAVTISGYITKNLFNRLKSELCISFMVENFSTVPYYNHLSRGNLTVPSSFLADLDVLLLLCWIISIALRLDRTMSTYAMLVPVYC